MQDAVNIISNGAYWQVAYRDAEGRRRFKSLGAKSKYSRRHAKKLAARFLCELVKNPGLGNRSRAITLEAFATRYLESRTELASGTRYLHQLTLRFLQAFFGADCRIERIVRSRAADWRTALAAGQLERVRVNRQHMKPLSEATVCQHVRNARTIFGQAVRDDLLPMNPFDRLKGTAKIPDKDWRYVTLDEAAAISAACPNLGWRVFFLLCRLAGLRVGEALALPWSSIDWENHRLKVFAKKTGDARTLPIVPELYAVLLEAHHAATAGESMVVSVGQVSRFSLRRRFHGICKAAGIQPWIDCFQVLRRNCETDWAMRGWPQAAVSEWIGHDMRVSGDFYVQNLEQLFREVAGLPQKAPQSRLPGMGEVRKSLPDRMEPTGIEPVTLSLQS